MEDLIALIKTLRGDEGCPWDRQQTARSMAVHLVEEVYEAVDAIQAGEPGAVREELGDVLFHIFFIAALFAEQGHFDIRDVIRTSTAKMIRRHPHVFGEERVASADEVRVRWRRIKQHEKGSAEKASILDSIPSGLPALMRAYRVSERAAGKGFDWQTLAGVLEKAEEEWHEFKAELGHGDPAVLERQDVAMEFGDILFTLVNVARFARIHPETALTGAIAKFEKRFRHMEREIAAAGRRMESVSFDELQALWQAAKTAVD